MWYEKAYRRHLCDMHIADWDEEFLSKFNAEDYFKNIETAKFDEAMIYLQSHVGYCNFPTESGEMHNSFKGRENEVNKLICMLREKGVAVVGYYSLIYNTIEHDKHPNWRLVYSNGLSRREAEEGARRSNMGFSEAPLHRYGLCCPNNKEYREFISKQIKEIAEYTKVDGMFYDMTYWPHICYCDECKKRWKEEVGTEFNPNPKYGSDEWLLIYRKHREWISEFAHFVTNETKKYMPHATVEHNVALSGLNRLDTCNSLGVHDACDYSGGDIHSTPYIQSFACKFYRGITKNQPFEFMTARCDPGLFKHTSMKSVDVLSSSVFLTAAHHGATLIIDAIDPCGTLDERAYKHIRNVFDMEDPYIKYFEGEPMADIGIYYGLDSKYNRYGSAYNNYTGATKLSENFIKNNILHDITGIYDKKSLDRFKMLFAPLLTEDDKDDNERLAKYVEDGGILYISGADNRELTEKLLGCTVVGATEETTTYVSPIEHEEIFEYFTKERPFNVDSAAAVIENLHDAEVVATVTLPYTKQNEKRFAAIHSNPPGKFTDMPAIVIKDYGKGKVIWSAQPFESESIDIYGIIFKNLIKYMLSDDLLCKTNASRRLELTLYKTEKYIYVNAVHINTDYYAETVNGFDIAVKCPKKPKAVKLLPNESKVKFKYENGYVKFKARDIKIFDMYRIVL